MPPVDTPPVAVRRCPCCQVRFLPWQVWRITRWTSIPCPHCGARLNRKQGVFFFLILFLGTAVLNFPQVFLLFLHLGPWRFVGAIVAFLTLLWLLDVCAVRLTPDQTSTASATPPKPPGTP